MPRLLAAALLASSLLASPAAGQGFDGALLHLPGKGVPPELSRAAVAQVLGGLTAPGGPRLQPPDRLAATLLAGESADALVERAGFLIEASRARYKQNVRGEAVTRDLLEARALLLRALPARPRVDLLREVWALAGLLAHGRGDPATAQEAFSRVLETDPSYRPDPRLFPPSARELMGRALLSRGSTPPRTLAAADAAAIGQRLGLPHLVVGHLRDTGLGDYVWRVDVLDVRAGAYTGHLEATFRPDPAERRAAAEQVVALVAAEVTPGAGAVASRPATPATTSRPAPAAAVAPTPQAPGTTEEGGPPGGWWLWAAVGAVALGGTAAVVGLSGGDAALEVRVHPPRR